MKPPIRGHCCRCGTTRNKTYDHEEIHEDQLWGKCGIRFCTDCLSNAKHKTLGLFGYIMRNFCAAQINMNKLQTRPQPTTVTAWESI